MMIWFVKQIDVEPSFYCGLVREISTEKTNTHARLVLLVYIQIKTSKYKYKTILLQQNKFTIIIFMKNRIVVLKPVLCSHKQWRMWVKGDFQCTYIENPLLHNSPPGRLCTPLHVCFNILLELFVCISSK